MRFQHARRSLGMGLMSTSLLAAMLVPLSASAAETDQLPEDRTTVATEDINRLAYWNSETSDTAPTAITKQFPPEAACLVAPQLCNFPTGDDDPTAGSDPTGGAVSGGIGDLGGGEAPSGEEGEPGLGAAGNALLDGINQQYGEGQETFRENEQGAPAEPVPSGSLPVSIAFGQPYYRSAIDFTLPTIPEGDVVDRFIVVFEQGNPTFSNASPALRQAVLATLTCARESDEEQGRCQREEFEKVAERDLRDEEPLPYQLCPVGEDPISGADQTDWEGGEAKSEETLPSTNCLFGTQGTQVDVDGATFWAFDLSLAMDAWAKGELPYEGMLFQPGAAENFAFGDAETSYSKQVTLLSENVSYALTTRPAPAPVQPFTPPALPSTTGTSAPPPGSGGGELFGTPPTPASNSPVSVPAPSTPSADAPAVAPGADTASPQVAGDAVATPTVPANAPGGSDWYVWLLLVPFLGGAYMVSQSLAAEAVLATERGGGALTRLLERQAATSGPDLVG